MLPIRILFYLITWLLFCARFKATFYLIVTLFLYGPLESYFIKLLSYSIKVLMATWTIRHGLMLLWFTDLMNVTEEVIIHRPNVSTLLSGAFIRGDLNDLKFINGELLWDPSSLSLILRHMQFLVPLRQLCRLLLGIVITLSKILANLRIS